MFFSPLSKVRNMNLRYQPRLTVLSPTCTFFGLTFLCSFDTITQYLYTKYIKIYALLVIVWKQYFSFVTRPRVKLCSRWVTWASVVSATMRWIHSGVENSVDPRKSHSNFLLKSFFVVNQFYYCTCLYCIHQTLLLSLPLTRNNL